MDVAKTGNDEADRRNFVVTIVILTLVAYLPMAF